MADARGLGAGSLERRLLLHIEAAHAGGVGGGEAGAEEGGLEGMEKWHAAKPKSITNRAPTVTVPSSVAKPATARVIRKPFSPIRSIL